MSQFGPNNASLDNLLSPTFYRSMSQGLTQQAQSLRANYKPYREAYKDRHYAFLPGLFGAQATYYRTAYPPGYQQAMSDATSYENQALYYTNLAQYIEDNPVQEETPTDEEIAAMDTDGPSVGQGQLTIKPPRIPSYVDDEEQWNTAGGGIGLRIPYGS